MREPPAHVLDADVLAAVRQFWLPAADAVEHLPVGFGAHHWKASAAGQPRLFVTFDSLDERRPTGALEDAYAAAADLAAGGLHFVVASQPAASGSFTMALSDGLLSCTPWLAGETGESVPLSRPLAEENLDFLTRLHSSPPPLRIPRWQPVVPEDLDQLLEASLAGGWSDGPFGQQAQAAIAAQLASVRRWTADYFSLVRQSWSRSWVPTHGEPHSANQLITASGIVLVDWESLALAPPERDLRTLVAAGYADLVQPDWSMIEMFDLEWRLDELFQYAAWFSRPHTGNASDVVALEDLVHELHRPDWKHL